MHLLYLLENLILPPSGCILLFLAGFLFHYLGKKKISLTLNLLGTVILYFSSIPLTATLIASHLEYYPPLDNGHCNLGHVKSEAIVVLGFRRDEEGKEYGGPASSGEEMERLRYAAYLHKCLNIPIFTIGGDAFKTGISQHQLMKESLHRDFGVQTSNGNGKSKNTWDNALYAKELLDQHKIRRILLVTHAWHLPRAVRLFERQQLVVTPAPTAYTNFNSAGHGIGAWIPSARAVLVNQRLLHEILGLGLSRIVK